MENIEIFKSRIDDLYDHIEKLEAEKLQLVSLLDAERASVDKLDAALKDMLLLIEQHGSREMLAHATRIATARRSWCILEW